jgi:hypothetical protein
MLSKQKLIQVLVGLKSMNSKYAVHEPSFLREICVDDDFPKVLRMFALVDEVVDSFDYTESDEFVKSVEGKSDAVRAMRRKLIDPVQRRESRGRFCNALAKLLESDEVWTLVRPTHKSLLHELRDLVDRVSNPDEAIR